MTQQELAEATREFDRGELPDDTGAPMTANERAELSSRKRTPRAPQDISKSVAVLISFDRSLLDRVDKSARSRGMGRSALIAEALELLLHQNAKKPRAAG